MHAFRRGSRALVLTFFALVRCTAAPSTNDGSTSTDGSNTSQEASLIDTPTPPESGANTEAGESSTNTDTANEASADTINTDTMVTDPRCAAGVDSDGDGVSNDRECSAGTDPLRPDTDADGLNDGVELSYARVCIATNSTAQRRPLVNCMNNAGCMMGERCSGLNPMSADSDMDGVSDGIEDLNGDGRIDVTRGETDPRIADTDGDGVLDGMSGIAICRPAGLATVAQTAIPVGPTQVGFDPVWGRARRVTGTMMRGAVQLDDPASSTSALVVTMPSMGTLTTEETRIETIIRTALGANTTPVLLGRGFTTHEGNAAITSTYRVARNTSASALRDALVMPLVGAAAMPAAAPVGMSTEFLVDFSLVRRTMGRSANTNDVIVTVAPRALLENRMVATALRSIDLVNATAIAENDRGLGYHCQTFRAGGAPQVDFLFPVDVSPSMDPYQQALGQTAQRFFTDMTAAGLDFRVVVLAAQSRTFNLTIPGLTWTLGSAMNGAQEMAFRVTVERFMNLPADMLAPYPNNGTFTTQLNEEPLATGVIALEQLASMSTPAALRLREGAQVAVFFMADETGTNDDNRFFALDMPRWGATYPARLRAATMFYSSRNALTFGLVNDQGSDCANPPANNAADMRRCLILNNRGAYIPIATATDADVAAAMARIVAAVAGAASPYRLERRPITSTIKVRVRNRDVPRSRSDGFDYDAVSNSVLFYGTTYRPARGDEVVLSYRLWQPCPGLGGMCTTDGECCSPQTCNAGRCGPPCMPMGAMCTTNNDCCAPNVCTDGRCAAPTACRMMGERCTTSADCCLPNTCNSGMCGPAMMCRPIGSACTMNSECCAPEICNAGRCGTPMCRPVDGMCTNNNDCCSGVCTSGRCGRPPCRNENNSCTSAADCCSGSCISGVCGPG